MGNKSKLAIFGGEKSVHSSFEEAFKWPLITKEHEDAVLEVLRHGNVSGLDVTEKFEKLYAEKLGRKYALACNSGTASIHCALYGLGVGVGDEVICPSITFWASIAQVFSLGATMVFAEIDPETLCIDPVDIEKRITERTKAIVVVHYGAMPCDIDAIMALAKKHNIKVLEDCSHAHGALYKGKEVGTFGDAAAFSLMYGKSLPVGEGGIMFTDDQRVYERALLLGHYARSKGIQLPDLKKFAGLPCGGYKYRMHQLSSAMGIVQLKQYPERMAEIDKSMNYFSDLVDEIPGIKSVRPPKGSGSTKGGWYCPYAHYDSDKFGGLSVTGFSKAILAEGSVCGVGTNKPLHLHPLFSEMDVYGIGKPTRNAFLPDGVSVIQPKGSLPISEATPEKTIRLPWFRQYKPEIIKEHAAAYIEVAENYRELLADDPGNPPEIGGWSTFFAGQ